MRIVIPGELPGMNEIISAAKAHYGQYSSAKADYTGLVAAKAIGHKQVNRATVRCHWYAATRRRDPDNIMAGVKFIMDGLVAAGVLPGDGWRYVAGIEHTFSLDREHPRVEVEILEAKEAAS